MAAYLRGAIYFSYFLTAGTIKKLCGCVNVLLRNVCSLIGNTVWRVFSSVSNPMLQSRQYPVTHTLTYIRTTHLYTDRAHDERKLTTNTHPLAPYLHDYNNERDSRHIINREQTDSSRLILQWRGSFSSPRNVCNGFFLLQICHIPCQQNGEFDHLFHKNYYYILLFLKTVYCT